MKVALHICCAVCAAGAAERLMQEGHQVYGFYYNPNIYPEEEYWRRLENVRKVTRVLGFSLVEGLYVPDEWFKATASLENEPEGGNRCPVCFKMRLEKAYQFMQESGCDAFTTTLTIGPNKSADLIGRIGQEIGGDKFIKQDFKKKEGLKRAIALSKIWGLYRQNYCGCLYSLNQAVARGPLATGAHSKLDIESSH
jgi:predicted adenine nucleotide alpha hydrolase (AANH) superfamily ATPase